MKSEYIKYSTKIWLTSVIVSPFLLISFHYLSGEGAEVYGFFLFVGLAIIYGAILSLLHYGLLIIGTKYILKTKKSKFLKRAITQLLILILVFGAVAIFSIVGDPSDWLEVLFNFVIFYLITLTFGVWYYDFEGLKK